MYTIFKLNEVVHSHYNTDTLMPIRPEAIQEYITLVICI